MSNDFDWSDVEDDVIVENVAAIAVYFNPKGAVVIRQEGSYGVTEDQVVVLPQSALAVLIGKLTEMQNTLVGKV